jgi:carbon-monoxide dehydrogenase small subunit
MSDRVTLRVNGRQRASAAGDRLIDVLRNEFHLTSVHDACSEGVCGACTVLVDGQAERACLTLAGQMEARDITTAEGFADIPALARIQSAFVTENALQCGYCAPGMMAAVAGILSDASIAADGEDAIRRELSSVVCRCTGYAAIVRAVQRLLRETAR